MKPKRHAAFTALILSLHRLALSEGIPTCAVSCLKATPTYNSLVQGESSSRCTNNDSLVAVICCVNGACLGSDLAATLNYLEEICHAVGVALPATVVCDGVTTAPSSPGIRSRHRMARRLTPPALATHQPPRRENRKTIRQTPTLPVEQASNKSNGSGGLSTGAKASIGAGAAVGGLAVLAAAFVVMQRRRKRAAARRKRAAAAAEGGRTELADDDWAELPGDGPQRFELDGTGAARKRGEAAAAAAALKWKDM
ncbi:hypothetical protein B0T26DRAFT_677188 [Lasiosphaeria miniovina]|uniref:CFEM domain-containing protein n=1 Tax=Lasiosphaeria miniovina TaxID=1954250 RepID=A0AA40ABB3_9PEZI|nr:uncharacterized protein B0T26DRAFT_677188 [Lasiosphaeria miniovina]KAK0712767.1 hypothetical protein B0T26DRAFT_677188 [Lasiosphaeria miniovina]